MKKTITISFSIPVTLADQLDNLSKEMNISRSAVLTSIISLVLKWNSSQKKEVLNSIYGRGENNVKL